MVNEIKPRAFWRKMLPSSFGHFRVVVVVVSTVLVLILIIILFLGNVIAFTVVIFQGFIFDLDVLFVGGWGSPSRWVVGMVTYNSLFIVTFGIIASFKGLYTSIGISILFYLDWFISFIPFGLAQTPIWSNLQLLPK